MSVSKKTEDRVQAMETQLGLNQERTIAYCGHPGCAWKIPKGFRGTIIGTGVPRPSCDTGNLEDDRHIFGRG